MTTLAPLSRKIAFTPISPAIGAEVRGVDISQELSAEIVGQIRAALVDRKVLVFRGQDVDQRAHVEFGRRFGDLTMAHPVVAPLDDSHPEIYQIDSTGVGQNDVWHTDVTFVQEPPMASILRPIRIPEVGGDTNWASLESAYESLNPRIQELADNLVAIHDGRHEFEEEFLKRGSQGNLWDGKQFSGFDLVEHPVVRVHPESGRKSLFVNPGFTIGIKGMSSAESAGLLNTFYSHITKPEHIYKHRWSLGDVVFWDNRSTVHYANNDCGDFHRLMQRITLKGDRPIGAADRSG